MRYRDHRGSLDESLKTVQWFNTREELIAHLNKSFEGFSEVVDLRFIYCGYDDRIDWDTYYVQADLKNGIWVLVGMSDTEIF